jgi:soluble cytochrome b562
MEELFKLAGTQGIWCVLSIFLLCWVIRNNKERETRYMQQLDKCNTRESEYQKIIQTFTNEIMPKLNEMSHEFKEGLHMIQVEVDDIKKHQE